MNPHTRLRIIVVGAIWFASFGIKAADAGASLDMSKAIITHRLGLEDWLKIQTLAQKDTNVIADMERAMKGPPTEASKLGEPSISEGDKAQIASILLQFTSGRGQVIAICLKAEPFFMCARVQFHTGAAKYFVYLIKANGSRWRFLGKNQFVT